MRVRKITILLLTMITLLSGCTVLDDVNESSSVNTIVQTEEVYQPSEQYETTVQPVTTAPLHSELFLPEYTLQQVGEYFSEVVLNSEYSTGPGDATLVQKWTSPIFYRIYGEPTTEDYAILEVLAEQLNGIPGFPGFYAAQDGFAENLSISFFSQDVFNENFSEVINGEYAFGAVQFWYYTDTNEIHTANIGCRTDIEQVVRNSVLQEEIINGLGISDTVLREDSIVYQYSDENLLPSEVDLLILKLLYSENVRCGMNYEECLAVMEELYY